MLKQFLALATLFLFCSLSNAAALLDINFSTDRGQFVMKPIHRVEDETLELLLTNVLFSHQKEINRLHYEDGKPWTKEKVCRVMPGKLERCRAWDKGDHTQFSWYIIFDETELPVGFMAGYLQADQWFQIAYARDVYNENLRGVMTAAYDAYFAYFLPFIETCQRENKFLGLYAPVHPDNTYSCAFLKKLNFEECGNNGKSGQDCRLEYRLPAKKFFARFALSDEDLSDASGESVKQ